MPGTFCASAKEVANGLVVVRKAVFAGGVLFIADRDAACVKKYDPVTGAFLGVIVAPSMFDKPIHLLAGDGMLYVGDRGNESVVKCDLRSGGSSWFIPPKAGGLSNPSGLAFGNNGFLVIAQQQLIASV